MTELLNIDVIRATPLFEGLGEEALSFIAAQVTSSTYEAGEVVAAEGSLGDCMFIIKYGAVDVLLGPHGPGTVKIARLSAGDFAGELSLIDSQPRSASLVASQKTEILIMNKSTLLDLHERDFHAFMKMIVNITRRIGNRLRQTDKVLASLSG